MRDRYHGSRTNMRRRLIVMSAVVAIAGCSELWTKMPDAGDRFDGPLPGLSPELLDQFVQGDENFGFVFTKQTGLGPIFVRASCAHCHIADGRGTPEELVTRFSVGSDLLLAYGGDQLQPHALPGVPPETVPPGVQVSRRLPPPVFGVGLIEAIPEEAILANADPDDLDLDGISGRPSWRAPAAYVPEGEVGGGAAPRLGRFGWKANFTSLLETVAHAYHQDMGLTSDFLSEEDSNPQAGGFALGDTVPDPELPAAHLLRTVLYVRLLAPPRPGEEDAGVAQGDLLFASMGCATCHVPSMATGPHSIEALSNMEVSLYSDLLLHDMGPGLADNRPDGPASGSEWRTRPLWGLRLVREFLDGRAFYLHDGRARTLEEAILAHGGEAQAARDAYAGLTAGSRDAVHAFLESL